jgi:hypothetical protein
MHRQHYGQASGVLVLQASHSILNPTIDPKIIEKALAEDAVAARSEWFGEFRSDISQYLSDELIDEAIDTGVLERPWSRHYRYIAFVDPSGGVSDAMTLAVAHMELGERMEYAVLDNLTIAKAPFEPEKVVRDFSNVLQRYGIRTVTGDRYGGEFPRSMFKKWGINYEPSDLDKSAIYCEAVPLFTQKRVDLLDIPQLIAEIRSLERKPRAGGRGDSVDHPPRGAHDDAANAAIGALHLASLKPGRGVSTQQLSRPRMSITE